MSQPNQSEYQCGGTLELDSPTYTIRKADDELYRGLKAGNFCYVFNARQTGKSSLRVQTIHLLQNEGIACAYVDLSPEGQNDMTQEQWYAGIIDTLVNNFKLEDFDFESWWSKQESFGYVKRFSNFIDTVLLVKLRQNNPDRKIVIFIDEIDSIRSLSFSTDNFFALLRAFYNQRADDPKYKHLTFCFIGTTTPSDLITDKTRTPFNIGQAIELTGFTLAEAKPTLMPPLAQKVDKPEIVLQEVLKWTGGQPFLTQKVCQLLVQSSTKPQENGEAQWVEEIVRNRIITNWQSQDEPQHLRTIFNRIISNENEKYRSRLLGLYQRILLSTTTGTSDRQSKVVVDESAEQVELRLSGLVVKSDAILQVYNRIYESVFDGNWVEKELAKIRPYADGLQAWFKSNCQDESRLLRGQALLDANAWAMGKSLGDRDNEFLRASDALEKQQAEIEKRQAEIALEQERKARELDSLEYSVNLEAERKSAEAERKSAEAEKQANNTLKKANKKANRRVLIGSIILVLSLLLSFFVVRQAEVSRQNALTATRLEQDGISLLRQSERQSNIDDLLLAMQSGRELKSLVKPKQSLADYPAYSPVFSLQTILLNIREKNRLEGHTSAVNSVAFSPDGKTLASASWDNTIKLWNISTGKLISTFIGHTDAVSSVAFSPDGKTLASASLDKTIILWNISTGKPISTLTGHTGAVWGVAFSPDGKTLASASWDKTIILWNISTGKLISTFIGHSNTVSSVAFSPDGKTLASASLDKTIILWNISTGKQISTFTGHSNTVLSVAFSPDGKTLASGSKDNTIKLWNISTGKLISTFIGHTDAVSSVAFSPDGKTLASASNDTTIKLWNISAKKPISTLIAHIDYVYSVAFSPDGKTLASGSTDYTTNLWNISTLKEISTFTGHTGFVLSVAFSPDGKTLASPSNDTTIKLWNISTGKQISIFTGHTDAVTSVAFSPDGKTLASASMDKTIKLWNISTLKEISTFTGHTDAVLSVAFSPDGKTLASGSTDYTIKLWNISTGKQISTFTGHTRPVFSVAFSLDGKTLASGSTDYTIKLWNISTGKQISTFTRHTGPVLSMAFSPDGKTLASASIDTTIKLWNISTGKQISTLIGHTYLVWGVAFSPDGKTLASGSMDKTIILWNISTGKQIFTLIGHTGEVTSVVFSPDGKTLASGSKDKTIILWNLDLDNLLTQGCRWLDGYLATRPDKAKELCPRE